MVDLHDAVARKKGETNSAKGNLGYNNSLTRWTRWLETLTQSATYPATFCGALEAAMHAARMDTKALAEATGAPVRLITNFRNGRTLPTYATEHFVELFEQALKLVPGTLASRVPETRNGKNTTGRVDLSLSDGRVIKLRRYWSLLPKGAASWPDDRLRLAVEDADARHFPKGGIDYVRTQAVLTNKYNLPPADHSSPIHAELDDMIRFRQSLSGDGRRLRVKGRWSDATAEMMRKRVDVFARWAMLDRAEGGCGLNPSLVSFSLCLNHQIVMKYIAWRISRSAELEVDGEPIGARITSGDRDICMFFAGVVDPKFGWLTQSRKHLQNLRAVPDKVLVPEIICNKDKREVSISEPRETTVLPPELIDGDWKEACSESNIDLLLLAGQLNSAYRLVRNPEDKIRPLLEHPLPMAVMFRMIHEALKRARPLETAPVLHATDHMRAVAMILLMTVVFRSETLRDMTWRLDNSGNLRWNGRTFDVRVDADDFKNGTSEFLFGPNWRRRDYERTLQDWGGLTGILKHYLETCRPILLKGRQSDLLFPPPKGKEAWDASAFNHVIKTFTRQHCVFNKRFGTGIEGVMPFGPHVCRNIVATHILKNHPDEVGRWTLAAYVLNTGIDQVKKRYGYLSVRDELAKSDNLIADASSLAVGGGVL